MNLALTVETMIAAGCSPEQIGAVVRAFQAGEEAKAASRRAKDAERKRLQRQREAEAEAASKMSRGQGVTDADSSGQAVTPQDGAENKKEGSPTPPKEKTTSSPSLRSGEAGVPPATYATAKHELWAEGKRYLGELGIAASKAGPMIGQWLKESGDDCAGVLDAIRRAREFKPQDPIAWIVRALPTRKQTNGHKRTVHDAARDLHEQVIAALAEPRPPAVLRLADYGERSGEEADRGLSQGRG
jgi:hypothetical protein